MRLIDADLMFKCETCRHHRNGGCNTYCDHGEEYSPDMSKLPTIDPEELRPKGECPICNAKDNGFIALNKTMEYSGIEIAANRQGMLRVRYYGGKDNFEAQDLIKCNYCPNCGAKMEVDDG